MKRICVFCGSHFGKQQQYANAAAALGKILADKQITLVYGGSDVGLMGTIAHACMESRGSVIGVMPRKLADMEVGHVGLSELIVVDTMHERKAKMAELADGFIALPGGIGTLEETLEMFTWVQLGLHNKPIGLLNTRGYYDRLTAFLQQVVDEGFMQAGHLEMLLIEADEERLVNRLIHYQPVNLSKWADRSANKVSK